MASLQMRQAVKRFGKTTVIHGVDLDVADGEFVVFVGPSGCGKSTLLRMICGLEPLTSGEVFIDGVRVNDTPAAQRGLAMVFQSYALYPHMSVRQNLAFGLENLRTSAAVIEERVQAAARLLRLDTLLERRPTQLSGGQRQRVAIGRAIVREPTIFLFDEPLSNLDAELRVSMRNEITALHRRLRTTMIYVTHDQVEAMTMADTIVVLRAGRIEQTGSPLALYNRPCNRFVAGFIGSPQMNFLDARVEASADGRVIVALAAAAASSGPPLTLPLTGTRPAVGTRVNVGIRPEHLRLEPPAEPSLTAEITVARVEQLGATTFVHGQTAGGEAVTTFVAGQRPFAVGATLRIHLPQEHVYVFDRGEGEPLLAHAERPEE